MSFKNRSLVTIDDLSNGEIEAVFALADEMAESMDRQIDVCHGKIMASLFFEPSTRTRLSFEAAMHRLGGNVISVSDAASTSQTKGESLADMARIVGAYADIVVIRHPWEGAAQVVANYAGVPVINAGDGGHQHPTQTLCDLYTIKKERQTLEGLKIALWGDLKYGRTIHSLIFALAKFGANILFCPSPGLEVPQHVIKKLIIEYGGEVETTSGIEDEERLGPFPVDAMYVTPSSSHQLAMVPDIDLEVELNTGVDALYVTRSQKERFTSDEGQLAKKQLPVVDKKLLERDQFKRTLVMHPLPRVDELAYELDDDPRGMYFKQAARGIPIRMALLSLLLGSREGRVPNDSDSAMPLIAYPEYSRGSALTCPNPSCVSVQASEIKYLEPEFKIVNRDPLTLRCVYCEHGFEPEYVASSERQEGSPGDNRYQSAGSRWARKLSPENLIAFNTEAEARSQGYKPGRYAKAPNNKGL